MSDFNVLDQLRQHSRRIHRYAIDNRTLDAGVIVEKQHWREFAALKQRLQQLAPGVSGAVNSYFFAMPAMQILIAAAYEQAPAADKKQTDSPIDQRSGARRIAAKQEKREREHNGRPADIADNRGQRLLAHVPNHCPV